MTDEPERDFEAELAESKAENRQMEMQLGTLMIQNGQLVQQRATLSARLAAHEEGSKAPPPVAQGTGAPNRKTRRAAAKKAGNGGTAAQT